MPPKRKASESPSSSPSIDQLAKMMSGMKIEFKPISASKPSAAKPTVKPVVVKPVARKPQPKKSSPKQVPKIGGKGSAFGKLKK